VRVSKEETTIKMPGAFNHIWRKSHGASHHITVLNFSQHRKLVVQFAAQKLGSRGRLVGTQLEI